MAQRRSGATEQPSDGGRFHKLGYHEGAVLRHLANTYPTVPKALVESTQNAVDANAKTVAILIDLKTRLVMVLDDGFGITVDRYERALDSIGMSIKDDPDALGEFGLGMIAPVPLCDVYTITSQPLGMNEVNQWTYEGKKIFQQKSVDIPFETLRALPPVPRQFYREVNKLYVRWRTVLTLQGITRDQATSLVELEDLESQILTKLGRAMRRKGTVVHVVLINEKGVQQPVREIKPGVFTGEKLEVVEYQGDLCGRIIFELYRAPKKDHGRRRGKVDVIKLGAQAAIELYDFRTQAMGSRWLREEPIRDAFDALGSGFFEGTVHIENVTLTKERDKFVMNDPLRESYIYIAQWFLEHGKQHYDRERDARRDQRYVDLGERSIERLLDKLRKNPRLAPLVRNLIGKLPEATAARPEPKPREPGEPAPNRPPVVAKERAKPKPAPPGATTPRTPREEASNFTISFAYEPIPGSNKLFEFSLGTGMLKFNILHKVWIALDETPDGKHLPKHDRQIMRLQEYIGFKVLVALSLYGPDRFETYRQTIDDEVIYYAPMFCEE